MNSLVSPPCFNDRLAIVFGQTRAIDKSLKFASNISSLSSDIFREIGSSSVACKGLDALAESFYTMRNGVKIFDTFQDLSHPSGDIHEVRMKWIQLVCFTIADVVNPILHFESDGFYTIGKELKKSMIAFSAKIGLFGLATNLIDSIYQFHKSLKVKNSIDNFFQEEAIEQQIEQLNEQKNTFFNKIERLKKCCHELDKSIAQLKCGADAAEKVEDIICGNESIFDSSTATISSANPNNLNRSTSLICTTADVISAKQKLSLSNSQALAKIQELEQKIQACEEKLSVLGDFTVGQRCLNKHFYQNLLSLIENILEISGVIISLAGVSSIAIPATTFIALIGVLSSTIAITKIWKQSGLTEIEEQKYQQLMNHISQASQNLNRFCA